MFLLDVRYNPKKNKIIKWIKSDESVYRHEETFYPKIYLSGINDINQRQLTERLRTLSYIKDISTEEKKTWLRRNPEKVMGLTMQKYIYDTASMLEKKGYHTYNVDIDPVRQYLLKENLFPTAKLKNNFDNTIICEHQNDIDYNIPDIDCRELKIVSKKEIEREKGIITADDPIGEITFGDIVIDQGSESEIIQEFYTEFINEDPDLILTEGGDNFDIPYLYNRASQYGIDLQLGRDLEIDDNKLYQDNNQHNNGRTYFSYGRIYYKPRKYTLSGRLHIDKSSFIYREGGLLGLIDISRLTRIPLQELSRLSPGSAVTALQVNQAIYDGILVPWRRNLAENWKTAEELLIADRGALVIEPKVGIHENVYELDFASLFPNIMVNYNISPETVLCDCCSSKKVPFINYNICEKHLGLVPRVLKPLIERRMTYKKRSKIETGKGDKNKAKEYDMKQNILKWLLVTSFGYMGFNKARFGRIECHESITAYARDILLKTIEFADDMGFEILHGIVDCLWIKGVDVDRRDRVEKLCDMAEREIGIPLELKGKFHWMVFLSNKSNGTGSLNRYYGLNTNGDIKVRGIEVRRSDTPKLIRDLQNSILLKLANAKTKKEFISKIYDVIEILREYTRKVLDGQCNTSDLILETRISRGYENYRQFNNQVAALKQFKQEGVDIIPGQTIGYVITDHKSNNYQKRVKIPQLSDDGNYDKYKYYQFLLRATESILLPFGYTEEKLNQIISRKVQKSLSEY